MLGSGRFKGIRNGAMRSSERAIASSVRHFESDYEDAHGAKKSTSENANASVSEMWTCRTAFRGAFNGLWAEGKKMLVRRWRQHGGGRGDSGIEVRFALVLLAVLEPSHHDYGHLYGNGTNGGKRGKRKVEREREREKRTG